MKEKCIYTKFAPERNKQFAVQTSIVVCDGIKYVKKTAMYSEAEQHIKAMVENCNILTDIYGKDCVAQCIHSTSSEMYMEYVSGETLSVILENLLSEKQYDEFYDLVNKYVLFIKKSCSDFCDFNNEYNFDFMSPNRITNIDFIFDNIIVRDDKFVIIDYEWLVTKIDYKYVLYRALDTFRLRSKDNMIMNWIWTFLKEFSEVEINRYKKANTLIYLHVSDNLLQRYSKKNITFFNSHVSIKSPVLFLDENGKYTLEKCIFMNANIRNDIVELKINPHKYGIYSKFRLDPIEGCYCELEILKVDTDMLNYTIVPFNATTYEENKYLFFTDDPILEFVGNFYDSKYFNIYYKINFLSFLEVTKIAGDKLNDSFVKMITCQKELIELKSSFEYRSIDRFRKFKEKFLKKVRSYTSISAIWI